MPQSEPRTNDDISGENPIEVLEREQQTVRDFQRYAYSAYVRPNLINNSGEWEVAQGVPQWDPQPIGIGFDEAVPKEVPAKPKGFTTSETRKMRAITERILLEIGNVPSQRRGRREGQYFELLKERKNETKDAREIIGNEVPVHVSSLSGKTLRKIESEGACPDFRGGRLLCATCHRAPSYSTSFFLLGRAYCALDLPNFELCATCGNFEASTKVVDTFDERTIKVCANCLRNRRACQACNARIDERYIEVRRCQDCIENPRYGDRVWREFSMSLKWASKELGQIVKSQRLFSSEIEALAPYENDMRRFAEKLPKECGISTDGSVGSTDDVDGYGFETQTPRLRGKKGEELVYRMGAALKDIGARVNRTCGMHIHLDGEGIVMPSRREYPVALLQLWKTHLIFEDVMLSFLPFARRRNDFCRPMRDAFSMNDIETCDSLLDIEKLWYKERTYGDIHEAKRHHYHSSRYFGVNFHSLLSRGHLEIRYHSGTTNPRKVLEWANLHALIMDAAAKKILTYDFLTDAQAVSSLREKTELLFAKIGLAESSRRYFLARQKKFSARTEDESETTD